MIRARMHGDEIDYVTQPGAVSQITEDSGEQKRARSQDAVIVSRRAQKIIEDGQRGGYRQPHKKPSCKTSAFLQLAESDTPGFSAYTKSKKPRMIGRSSPKRSARTAQALVDWSTR